MYGNRYEDDNGKHSIAKIICYKKFDAIPTSILWIFNFDKKKSGPQDTHHQCIQKPLKYVIMNCICDHNYNSFL